MTHPFEEKFYEDTRVDAVAMERLTASPRIINVHGHCGLTVVQEFAGREVSEIAGELSSRDKLRLALRIAERVADIHHIDGSETPVMVHNDINPANLVFTDDGRPVLNDFNIAVLLMKHNETGETCPFYSHFPNPQWKAPEEQVEEYELQDRNINPPVVNEKIDLYAVGNVLYRLVVGASPWKKPGAERLEADEKVEVARLKKYNGTLPDIPDEVLQQATKEKDPSLAALLEAMRLCYRADPNLRPTARSLVAFLQRAIQQEQQPPPPPKQGTGGKTS
jgi:serine/threonine protein kinase